MFRLMDFITGILERSLSSFGSKKEKTPLAWLVVLEGPADRVGQELRIFSEVTRLGSNAKNTDFTFYPGVLTSVSGLHARIEKTEGAWQIVAVSQSGSETFVNDRAIPFHTSWELHSGDMIRLGYVTANPVVLKFLLDEETSYSTGAASHDVAEESEMEAALPGDPSTDAPPPQ